MRIRRTIAPAAAPISASHVWRGLTGILSGELYLNRLEKEIKAYFGVRHVFLVSS